MRIFKEWEIENEETERFYMQWNDNPTPPPTPITPAPPAPPAPPPPPRTASTASKANAPYKAMPCRPTAPIPKKTSNVPRGLVKKMMVSVLNFHV